MELSPQLSARFGNAENRYPVSERPHSHAEVQPGEYGFISDEISRKSRQAAGLRTAS